MNAQAPITPDSDAEALVLDVRGVGKEYPVGGYLSRLGRPRQVVRALDDVWLTVRSGEIVGLAGESGSGKSTLGRLIVGLEKQTSGEIRYGAGRGNDALTSKPQMTFQSPSGSLNPRQRVKDIIGEPLRVHRGVSETAKPVLQLMEQVGLPAALANRYPHELSGGQCQRVGIARALTLKPALLVCDEPASALDVSIQAQILNLFADLQEQTHCSYLFISHDLPVARLLSHRLAIMYLGRIVETGPTAAIFQRPGHPYTRALIHSAPKIGGRRAFEPVKGEIPSPLDPPSGCHFHPRCPLAVERCRVERPKLREVGSNRLSACHRSEDQLSEAG